MGVQFVEDEKGRIKHKCVKTFTMDSKPEFQVNKGEVWWGSFELLINKDKKIGIKPSIWQYEGAFEMIKEKL